MSTGLECEIIEHTPNLWYCVLQNWDCPVGAWDWREYATAYGPFPSPDEALADLFRNHANPGGYSVQPFASDNTDPVIDKLVVEAQQFWGTERG
jgi:hypothetical protein